MWLPQPATDLMPLEADVKVSARGHIFSCWSFNGMPVFFYSREGSGEGYVENARAETCPPIGVPQLQGVYLEKKPHAWMYEKYQGG